MVLSRFASGGSLALALVVLQLLPAARGHEPERYAAGEADKGLVAHYPLDGDARDAVGRNDGRVVGARPAEGRSGEASGALRLDGRRDQVVVPHKEGLDFADGEFTVALWFRTQQPAQRYLVAKDYGPRRRFWGISVCGATVEQGVAALVHDGTTTSSLRTPHDFADGRWHHVAFVRDTAARRLKLYVDGVLRVEAEDKSGSVSNDAPVLIGDIATPGYRFDGCLDDARFYNRALSAEEVRTLHGGAPERPALPGAGWAFDVSVLDSRGQPVAGATVTLHMLKPEFRAAEQRTDEFGKARMAIAVQRAPADCTPLGLFLAAEKPGHLGAAIKLNGPPRKGYAVTLHQDTEPRAWLRELGKAGLDLADILLLLIPRTVPIKPLFTGDPGDALPPCIQVKHGPVRVPTLVVGDRVIFGDRNYGKSY